MSAWKVVLNEAEIKKNARKEYQSSMYRERVKLIKEIAHLLLPELQCRGETRDVLQGIREVFENKFPEKIGKENGVKFRRTVQFNGSRVSIWATADFSKNYELFLERKEEKDAMMRASKPNKDSRENAVGDANIEEPVADELTQIVNYHIDRWVVPDELEAQLGRLKHTPSPIDFYADYPMPTPLMNHANYEFEAVQVDRGYQEVTGHLPPSPPMNAYSHSLLSPFRPPAVNGMMRHVNVDAYANPNVGVWQPDPTLLELYSPRVAFGQTNHIHENTDYRFH
ncbi:hypothetical protein CAEBREN_07838 [Caenorhabditis brenneri]|uniref:Uncharacterized protein n=1 Tax=Caenorhabditis brenneri TaxID=135651 RepID=G0MS15_CAEBE|nr:hypothetical protein CAEBREN_07838 [Caenorhabditis brenneri]